MISFSLSELLYTKPIEVHDPKNISTYGTKFFIKYSSELQSSFKTKSLGIFGSTKVDEKLLFEVKKTKEYIEFKNICIFPCTSIYELSEILALSLKLSPYQVHINFLQPETTCSLKPKEIMIKYPSYDITNAESYNKSVSIGYSKLLVEIEASNVSPITFYENTFYDNYLQIGSYVNSIYKQTSSIKGGISVSPIISGVSILLIYEEKSMAVDISKLFNLHTAGNIFSKVYIQSRKVDSNEMNEREMQYVKTPVDIANPFNGVNALYETCSLYLGEEISSGITLSSINVCENATITINFTVIDSQLTYDDIKQRLGEWADEKLVNLIDSTAIDECVYDVEFNSHKYVPIYGDITSSILVPGCSLDDIGNINILTNQTIPTVKFPTKTSIQFSMYAFNTASTHYTFDYLLLTKAFLTDNFIQRSLLPTCHAAINISTDVVTISSAHAGSYREMMYHYMMIMGIFSNIGKQKDVVKLKPAQTLKEIQKRATAINKKQLLKILYSTDPTLFGERKVGNSKRPYSGLAQKSEQRVVPITQSEYNIVKNSRPQSVADIQNQTYPAQRLYLFCPYERTSYVNFHSIPGQLCIPRCTTKLSNKSQLSFCIKSLDVKGVEVVHGVENQSITLYNPIISRGRKCKLPAELNSIFPNYLCLKLNVGLNDVNEYYSNTYGNKKAFVIKRDATFERYEIWTEYYKGEDYILTLFAERTQDDVFVVIDKDNKPLLFSDNEAMREFFSKAAVKTSAQLQFFDFVESIIKKEFGELYSLSVNDIIKEINRKYKTRIAISSNVVFGIIHNGKLFFSPSFYWQYSKGEEFIQISDIAKEFREKKTALPELKDFDSMYITELYIDYKTQNLYGLKYKNTFSFIRPSEVPKELNSLPKILFDFASVFRSTLMNVGEEEVRTESRERMIKHIRDLEYTYLFVYLIILNDMMQDDEVKTKNIQNAKFDKNDFMQFLEKNKFISTEDIIVFATDDKKFVSWRKSKLSKKQLDSFMHDVLFMDTYNITAIIYQQLQQTLNINVVEGERLHMKIIT